MGVDALTINLPGDTRAEWLDKVRWFGAEVVDKL